MGGFDPSMIMNIAGAAKGAGGEGGGSGMSMPMQVETPGDTANKIAEPFAQYVTDAKAKAQVMFSDPVLRQQMQVQPQTQQQPAKKEDTKKEDQQAGGNEFQKMMDYINLAKGQSDLKNGAGAAGAATTNIPIQTA